MVDCALVLRQDGPSFGLPAEHDDQELLLQCMHSAGLISAITADSQGDPHFLVHATVADSCSDAILSRQMEKEEGLVDFGGFIAYLTDCRVDFELSPRKKSNM